MVCSKTRHGGKCYLRSHMNVIITSIKQRLGSAFNVNRPSLLCQVGDDVIRPCKICGDARSVSQDPFTPSMLSSTILTPICIRIAFFLRQRQLLISILI